MGPPYHVASDLFVLSIGNKDRVGILVTRGGPLTRPMVSKPAVTLGI